MAKKRLAWAHVIYGCDECHRGCAIALEDGIESNTPNRKPAPFVTKCPFCGSISFHHTHPGMIVCKSKHRIRHDEPFFAYEEGETSGVPKHMEYATVMFIHNNGGKGGPAPSAVAMKTVSDEFSRMYPHTIKPLKLQQTMTEQAQKNQLPEEHPHETLKHMQPLTPEAWLDGLRKEINGHEHADINWVWERVLNHLCGYMVTTDLWLTSWTDDEKKCIMPLITYTHHESTGLAVVIYHDDEKNVWCSKLVEGGEIRLHLNTDA